MLEENSIIPIKEVAIGNSVAEETLPESLSSTEKTANKNIGDQGLLNTQDSMSNIILPATKKAYQGKKRGRKPKTVEEKSLKKQKTVSSLNIIPLSEQNVGDLPINSLTGNGSFQTEIESSNKNNNVSNAAASDPQAQKTLAHLYHRREFVCDRCNTLRRACFGMLSSCNNCLIANKECTLNRPRMRKSKPRQLKVMEMAIPVCQSLNVNTLQLSQHLKTETDSKSKQLELVVKNLRSELKDNNKEKKIRDDYYKELEIENAYLKDTVTTLQQLFKEQQNLVQLLEEQQLQNFQKLKNLQNNQLPLQNDVTAFTTQETNPQFQLRADERRDWLLKMNHSSSNQSPSDSNANSYCQQHAADNENLQTQNALSRASNILQNKIYYHQLENEPEQITSKIETHPRKMATTWSGETSIDVQHRNDHGCTDDLCQERKQSLIPNSNEDSRWIASQFINQTNNQASGELSVPTSNKKNTSKSKNDVDLYMIM